MVKNLNGQCRCRKCWQRYDYIPHTKSSSPYTCPSCSQNKNLPWRCECGEEFPDKKTFFDHRREMKKKGKPCYLEESDYKTCKYCGAKLRPSKGDPDEPDTVGGHLKVCSKYLALKKQYGCYKRIPQNVAKTSASMYSENVFMELLTQNRTYTLDATNPIKSMGLEASNLTYHMWVLNCLLKSNLGFETQTSPNAKWTHDFFIDKKVIITFDNEMSEDWQKAILSFGWNILNLRWGDCILKTEESENKVIEFLKTCTTPLPEGTVGKIYQ